MADTQDYVAVYKKFFEDFAKTIDPDDQLPVKVAGYRLNEKEIVGETVDWTFQYLSQRNCPPSLLAPITRVVIDEIKQACETQPAACGFRANEKHYTPLMLMHAVMNKVNEVCLRFRDNGRVTALPPPTSGPLISSCAVKNSRRCMEDRHVIIQDFHGVFNINDPNPASYYAVFDGHAGTEAAVYSVCHLHQFLAESSYYPSDPARAIHEAFLKTDALFIEKSNKENLRSGTTAVCALLRPKEKKLYVAWLGDSQVFVVKNGQALRIVHPHKPDREDEVNRIQSMGGSVVYWGTWRVNGQLAVSRAIGDPLYKPYVTGEPDVTTLDLNGDEDYIVLACDGLWDFATPEQVVEAIQEQLKERPGDVEAVSQRLVQLSKQQGSTDNITVIVAFLTDPLALARRPDVRATCVPACELLRCSALANGPPSAMEALDVTAPSAPASTNPFDLDPAPAADPVAPALPQKSGMLLDFAAAAADDDQADAPPPYNNGHANGLFDFDERPTNGKVAHDDEDDASSSDEDSAPEVIRAAPTPPAPAPAPVPSSIVADFIPPSLPVFGAPNPPAAAAFTNPFGDDLELQRQQTSEFDPPNEPRRDTPTPPADEVPGVTDNVAESGEDSEDEWNYFKSPQPSVQPAEQKTQTVCQETSTPTEDQDDSDMESRLNPNAAEFIPSPTNTKPPIEEFLLSQSKAETNMDDVIVPSSSEFEHEVSLRPSDVGIDDSLLNNSTSSDLVNGQNSDVEKPVEFTDSFQPSAKDVTDDVLSNILDDSEGFSTKAEFGDESTASFLTGDLQKTSENTVTESSILEQESIPSEAALEENAEAQILKEIEDTFQDDIFTRELQKEPVHISFELQKEIAPQMESQPEVVKVDSEEPSPTLSSQPEVLEVLEPDLIVESKPDDDFLGLNQSIELQKLEMPVDLLPPFSPSDKQEAQEILEEKDIVTESPAPAFDLPVEGSNLLEKELDSQNSVPSFPEFGQGDANPSDMYIKDPLSWRCVFPLPPETDTPVRGAFGEVVESKETPEYEKLEKEMEAFETQETPRIMDLGKQFEYLSLENDQKVPELNQVAEDVATTVGSDILETKMEDDLFESSVVPDPIGEKQVNEVVPIVSVEVKDDVKEELKVDVENALQSSETTQAPPPTPAPGLPTAETEGLIFVKEPDNLVEVAEKLAEASEKVTESSLQEEESKIETIPVVAAAAAAAAAATTVAAAAVGTTTAAEKKDQKKDKETIVAKKTIKEVKDKKSLTERPKTVSTPKPSAATRTTLSSSNTNAKAKSPTSPLKPTAPPPKPAVKKAPAAPTARPSPRPASSPSTSKSLGSSTNTTTTTTARPKPAVSAAAPKPAPRVSSIMKSRPSTATTTSLPKKPLANGDAKAPAKRPEPSAPRTSTRPTSAPATKTVSRTVTASSTLTKSKPPAQNGPSKPSLTATRTIVKTTNEKDIKDTANKQISSRTTTTVRSSTATTRTTTSTTATRRIESKPLTNGKATTTTTTRTNLVKTSATSKVPPKKLSATTVKTTKTTPSKEKSETVQESTTVMTTNNLNAQTTA